MLANAGPWDELKGVKLSSPTVQFVCECLGFPTMSPVQAKTIPLFLTNRDVVVEALTGSGKTLAYLIPCVELMLRPRTLETIKTQLSDRIQGCIYGVIILPSRELAQQVHFVAHQYVRFVANKIGVKLETSCFVGGRSVDADLKTLADQAGQSHVVVGTPGRLFELFVTSKFTSAFHYGSLEILVLDEADKLLEMGFRAKLDSIIKKFPKQRRTGLFSATQTKELADLARAGMRNPVCVSVRLQIPHRKQTVAGPSDSTAAIEDTSKPQVPHQLINFFAITPLASKLDRLVEFIKLHKQQKILVYVLTCASVDWLFLALRRLLLPQSTVPNKRQAIISSKDKEDVCLIKLHGRMPMKERKTAHKAVTISSHCVLVCTDVAARGLDIPEVSIVVQMDPPVIPQTFIHRIGRTARFGKSGVSVVFITPQELDYIEFLRLQNIVLVPLDESRDNLEAATLAAENVKKVRTLASVKESATAKKKWISKAKKMELRVQRTQRELRRGPLKGDMCMSDAVLDLRRAAAFDGDATLLELASNAFVSYIRAYKEHECRYIFQLKKIDITELVHSFALFKVPNCGEIRKMRRLAIPLQDEFHPFVAELNKKIQEAKTKRAEALQSSQQERAQTGKDVADAAKKHRTERSEKFEKLKAAGLSRNERNRAFKQAELDEIMKDSYYIKKEKMGRIPKHVVDEIMGTDELENATLTTRERNERRRAAKKRPRE